MNEEKLSATVRANLFDAGIVPWAAVRYNLLIGLIDEAHAGIKFAFRTWSITPEILYSYPSYDGDSIFNVFATNAYWDMRMTFDFWPNRGPLRMYAREFLRRFSNGDFDTTLPTETVETEADAYGLDLGARYTIGGSGMARADLYYEDGYGGLREGGDLSTRWKILPRVSAEGRVSVVHFHEDSLTDLYGTSLGLQAGGVWTLTDGVAIHLEGEENANRFYSSELRVIAILDLSFKPEH